jgi:hypothetical protein
MTCLTECLNPRPSKESIASQYTCKMPKSQMTGSQASVIFINLARKPFDKSTCQMSGLHIYALKIWAHNIIPPQDLHLM